MFPIRDDNPTVLTPIVTVGLIAANLATWVLVQGLGAAEPLASSVCTLGLIPGELLQRAPAGTELPLGEGLTCVLTDTPHWHTLVTSMFLHGGWLHLLGNMWFLWVFGNNVEDSMGHLRFLGFYLATGLVAAMAQVAVHPASAVPMVGASGAISGVMGAYIILYPRVRVHMFTWLVIYPLRFRMPAWLMLGYWFFLQVVGGLPMLEEESGGVAFWAHAGGFVAGMMLVFLFRNAALINRRTRLVSPYGWAG